MKHIKTMVLLFAMVLMLSVSQNASAATTKTAALKAYASFLAKTQTVRHSQGLSCSVKNCYFAIACIDNNDIPELVLYTPDSSHVAGWGLMYTYENGKIKKKNDLQLNLRSTLGYYLKTGIYLDNYSAQGTGTYWYQTLSGSILGSRYVKYKDGKWVTNGYMWANRMISSSTFNSKLKAKVGSKKLTLFKFYKNNVTNRRNYLGYSGIQTVAVTEVLLNQTSVTLTKGNTYTLSATVKPTNATNKNLTWSSSNTDIATVVNGKIIARNAGVTTITVKSNNGKKATCRVTVKNPITPSISIRKSVNSGSSYGYLTATTVPANRTVTWTSSNTNVIQVDTNGNLTVRGSGSATIRASFTYSGKTYSSSISLSTYSMTHYGTWSEWTTDYISETTNRQVDTKTVYRYYCFYCPVCGGREPFQGTSDCHRYNLSLSNGRVKWSTIPYSRCNPRSYSYTTAKYYTESLGDGLRWNFSAGNRYHTTPGTLDASGPAAVVIAKGYRYRSRSYTYHFN